MNFRSSSDINIIHIRLLKCALQISRPRVLKKWKLNTNISKEDACTQALISKMNLLRSVNHGRFVDTQETEITREIEKLFILFPLTHAVLQP